MISVKLLKINHNTVDSYNILKEILISKSVYDVFKDFLNPDKKQCINIIYPTGDSILQDVLFIDGGVLTDINDRISIMIKRLENIMKLSNTNNCVTVELISDIYDLNSLNDIIKEYSNHNSNYNFVIFIDLVY